jgi:hypothetical protein
MARGVGNRFCRAFEKTVPDPLALPFLPGARKKRFPTPSRYQEYRNMTCVVRMNPPWDTMVPKAEFPWIVFI